MTDILLSSFLSLFALFGKEESVDEAWAKTMLENYLRHHFGIRNIESYLGFYSDLRNVYEMSDVTGMDPQATVDGICTELKSKISHIEASLLLLRLMEFCSYQEGHTDYLFTTMAKSFQISDVQFKVFVDFVNNRQNEHVMIHELSDTKGQLKTLLNPETGMLLFTYTGPDTVLLNDVPVLSGAYQVWIQSSVLKGATGKPIYYSTILDAYRAVKGLAVDKTEEVEFCGRDINFRFPNSDNGMHDLSFTLRNGELLAIMGGSGTGKTTLLSLLNGTLKPQSGSITINGHDISEPDAKALIGFVPQDDLLIEELTVYQNLWFTAKLCFEGMSEEDLDKRVMKTLKDLGLDAAKNLKVGSAINKFISGGQRKRLNIALELIREPAVLFLDEPTSGLSSADTEKVINLLKEQTQKGKLIIVNIHQPSSDVYKLFDRLWLLDKGGYPVFDGNPIDAITYFKTAADYADADTSACPTCGNVNPEIVLNIIDEKALNNNGEISDERKMSPQEWHELYLKNRAELPAPEIKDVPHSDQKKPNAFKQFLIFLRRNFRTKITNVQYLCITLLEAPLLAVVCALLTRYAPPEGYTVMDNKNLVSYFFMAVIVATFIGMSGSAEEIIKDRALLKRESFLNLSYGSYISSKIVYMAGVSLLQTLLFILIGNYIMGLHGLFLTWWIILFVTALLSSLMGLLLCGLVVSFSDLAPKSTTGNVPLIGEIIPTRWAYEALAVTSYSDNAYEAPFFETDRKKYETQFYNFGYVNELQSQLETMKNEEKQGEEVNPIHMETIRINLPLVTAFCGMEPYKGDYSYPSLRQYLKDAENILVDRSNTISIKADKQISAMVREMGKDAVLELKRDNYNIKLEDCVVGADQRNMLEVIDGYIVPRMQTIFLTPQNTWGRAPFYSSVKILGTWQIKTLWFNISVLLLMGFILSIFLFTDWPGKIIRK